METKQVKAYGTENAEALLKGLTMLKSDVKYRFVIDMASLSNE